MRASSPNEDAVPLTSMVPPARNADYGARIRAIREALGRKEGRRKAISQEDFAARVGCHPSAVKKWESGGQDPGVDSLRAINRVVPEEYAELRFRLDEQEHPSPSQNTPIPPVGVPAFPGDVEASAIRALLASLRPDLAPAQIEKLVAMFILAARP